MSYGSFSRAGTIALRRSSIRSATSCGTTCGASSVLFWGRYDSSSFTSSIACGSLSASSCATPLRLLCTTGPPRSTALTCSPVTALMTSGPVMNMKLVPSAMITKSVSAGEYTAPPAHGPRITEICGMTPDASTLRVNISP